jgi:hypothetical protein
MVACVELMDARCQIGSGAPFATPDPEVSPQSWMRAVQGLCDNTLRKSSRMT